MCKLDEEMHKIYIKTKFSTVIFKDEYRVTMDLPAELEVGPSCEYSTSTRQVGNWSDVLDEQ